MRAEKTNWGDTYYARTNDPWQIMNSIVCWWYYRPTPGNNGQSGKGKGARCYIRNI